MSHSTSNGNGNGQPPHETMPTAADTQPTLACPDDTTQALAWLPAAQLTLTRAYDQLAPPDPGKLRELAISIAREGLLQPLLVTPRADGRQYVVVVGRRRWMVASTTGALVPALVRQFSPRQKYEAFLAAHVCTVVPPALETLTTAYDATWTTVVEEDTSDVPHTGQPEGDRSGTEDAATIAAVTAQLRQLSPFVYRHLAREIVTGDDTLWESLLAEARQQVRASDASDRARAAQELATAHDAVRAAEQQQQRQSQTVIQLGQQLTEARIRYQRCDEQRQENERQRYAVSTENRQLHTHVQQLRARLEALEPVDAVTVHPQRAALAQAALDVIAAAGVPLLTPALRVLHPRTGSEATLALARALDVVEERIQRCRHCLTEHAAAAAIGHTATVQPETEVTP
jgi:TolA-binding protein